MPEAHPVTGEPRAASDLTAFQQNILVVLAKKPMYGLAIKEELEAYYGEDVNHGRLYPNLDELVGMDYVEKSERDKRTNEYELTEEGREVILDQFDWMMSKFDADELRNLRDTQSP